MRFTAETREVLEMQNVTSALHEGTDDYVTTKFSYPWCSARKSPPDLGNRVRVVRVAKSVKFASGSKELGSILLCHRLKKYPDLVDLASIRSRIHSAFKNLYSGERIQKVADLFARFTGYV